MDELTPPMLPLPAQGLPGCYFTVVHRGPAIADFWCMRAVRHTARLCLAYARYFNCEHYDTCLDLAIKEGWEAFTCEGCAFFHRAVCAPEAYPPRAEGTPSWTPREVEEAMGLDALACTARRRGRPRKTALESLGLPETPLSPREAADEIIAEITIEAEVNFKVPRP